MLNLSAVIFRLSITSLFVIYACSVNAGLPYSFHIDPDDLNGTPVSTLNQKEFPGGITNADRIYIRDGHFYTQGLLPVDTSDDRRIRFWGINITAPMSFLKDEPRAEFVSICAADAIDDEFCEIEILARRFDKMGINIVRLFALDNNYYINEPLKSVYKSVLETTDHSENIEYPTFNETTMAGLDRLIAVFKQHGIYVHIPLRAAYTYSDEDCYTDINSVVQCVDIPSGGMPKNNKPLDHFDVKMIALQNIYHQAFLNRINYVTQVAYKDEPAIASFEITNESSLIQYYKDDELEFSTNFPDMYGAQINQRWHDWLEAYYTRPENLGAFTTPEEALRDAWAPSQIASRDLIRNGDFESINTLSFPDWPTNSGSNSAHGCTPVTEWGTGTVDDGEAVITLKEKPCESKPYLFQMKQVALGTDQDNNAPDPAPNGIAAGTAYRVSFTARTDSTVAHDLSIAVQYFDTTTQSLMNETVTLVPPDINNLDAEVVNASFYFYSDVDVTDAYLTFTPFKAPDSLEASLLNTHVYIDDVKIVTATATTLADDTGFDTHIEIIDGIPTAVNDILVPRPSRDYSTVAPPVQQWEDDYQLFFYETEHSYYLDLYNNLKSIVNKPITGSQATYGGLAGNKIMADVMDFIDIHFYWDNSKNKNTADEWLYNVAMVDNPLTSFAGAVASSRVSNMPFTVTEYGMPDPNEFRQESLPMIASYAAQQDLDAIFLFSYSPLGGGFDSRNIIEPEPLALRGAHNTLGESMRESLIHLAANIFRRGDATPSIDETTVHLSLENVLDQGSLNNSLGMGSWLELSGEIIDQSGLDAFSRSIALTKKVSISHDGAVQDEDFPPAYIPGLVHGSDNNELIWDDSSQGPASAHLLINTQRSKAMVGYGNGTVNMNGLTVMTPAGQFGSTTLTAMDHAPLATSSEVLVTTVGKGINSTLELVVRAAGGFNICNVGSNGSTCGDSIYQPNKGPFVIETNTATIDFLGAATSITVESLAIDGTPNGAVISPSYINGGYRFTVGTIADTPWFKLTAIMPEPEVIQAETGAITAGIASNEGSYIKLEAGAELTLEIDDDLIPGDFYIEYTARTAVGSLPVSVKAFINNDGTNTDDVAIADVLQGAWQSFVISQTPIAIAAGTNRTLKFVNTSLSGGNADIESVRIYRANTQPLADADGDTVVNNLDNCPLIINTDQLDNESDGAGDVCDSDDDNDGSTDTDEITIYFTNPLVPDTDGDGVLDGFDIQPLTFNVAGDVSPRGAPNGIVNAADLLTQTQFILGTATPSSIELQNGDLYPLNAPDGIINTSDLLLMMKIVLP